MKRWRASVHLLLAGAALAVSGVQGCERSEGTDAAATAAAPEEDREATPGSEASDHPKTGWCKGHGLPEAYCTKCHPELAQEFKAEGDWCAEHGFPESACPLCHPAEPPAGARREGIEPGTVIRFADAGVEEAAGVEVAEARRGGMPDTVSSTARVEYDRNRMAEVRALVPGIIREVLVDLGQAVEAGDVLFVLESTQVGDLRGRLESARQQVRAARSHLRRQRELRGADIASARDVELASRDLGVARAEVRSLEASLEMAGAGVEGENAGRYAVTAPLAGTVVRRPAVLGVLATAETSLATVADTSRMWALLEVPEGEAAAVRTGQAVTLEVNGADGRGFRGELAWVGSEVDRRTRTVPVRAEVSNADGLLRAHQFARATVEVGAPEDAVVIPREAVQRFDGGSVVFVRLEPGVYEPREVRTGRRARGRVQVRGEVRPGEEVVTTGAYLLKTELDPGSIGAGCCEVD